jgi:hypothetical protein
MILAVGGILSALAYLGPIAIRTTQSWGGYRAEAESEKGSAEMEAQFARDAGRQAEQVWRERRMSEAEQPTFRTSAVDFLRIPVRTARAQWLRIAMAVREVPRQRESARARSAVAAPNVPP